MIGQQPGAYLAIFLTFCVTNKLIGDELCPGCYGKGRVGCGRCSSAVLGTFVGKCPTCCGFYTQSLRPGEICPTCRGTQVCIGCNGQGAACLVCKGSGRVVDGFAKAVAAERARKQSAGIDLHVKQRLHVLAGRWTGEGEDVDQGRFRSEMRWTSGLDGSYLRHEERIAYAAGAVSEFVSYLTWEESDQKYLWIILFAPGKGILARGTPSGDATITWDVLLDGGSTLKMHWSLDAAQGRFQVENAIEGVNGSRGIGSSRFRRVGPAGSELVTATSNPKPGDPATNAVLDSLSPLSVLIGKWNGVGSNAKGLLKSQSRWSAILSGTVYENESSTTYADGKIERSLGALSFDSNERKIVYIHLAPQGAMSIFKGNLEAGATTKATINVQGASIVWNFAPDGRKLEWFVDVADAAGGRKIIEQGTDVKE